MGEERILELSAAAVLIFVDFLIGESGVELWGQEKIKGFLMKSVSPTDIS